MKFDELSSLPSASEMIAFWRSLPCEHFPEMIKFARIMPVSSGLRTNASSRFLPRK